MPQSWPETRSQVTTQLDLSKNIVVVYDFLILPLTSGQIKTQNTQGQLRATLIYYKGTTHGLTH